MSTAHCGRGAGLGAAVVMHQDSIAELRAGLLEVVGGTYWHTTESLLSTEGRQAAVRVAEYLGHKDGGEVAVVSCKSPVEDCAVCRHCQLKQASPRDEALLWLPDLVSSAVRRRKTHGELYLLDPIADIVQLIQCP